MATDVSVYNPGGSFISDLGKTVLPADIKPMDFSSLDKALATENDLSSKAINVMTKNVDAIGKIQDDLTGIPTPLLSQQAVLADRKKAHNVDEAAFTQAANNIDNPMALYQMDRNIKKLYVDPVIKDMIRDNAILDDYKDRIKNIEDPYMRATAIKGLADLPNSPDPDAIKKLNIDQYKTIDLEDAYTQALDKFAPYTSTSEQVTKNGVTSTVVTTQRDPDMVKKTREYFQKNPTIKNNLSAQGYIDENGDPKGTWFDDIEKGQSQTTTQIKDVKGAVGGSGAGGTHTPGDYSSVSYSSNIGSDGVDYGVTQYVETGTLGAEPANSVHTDGSGGVNLSRYSFNRKAGKGEEYIQFLGDIASANFDPELVDLVANLKKAKTVDENKAAYKAIQDKVGGPEALAKYEDQFASERIAAPRIEEAAGILGKEHELTSGEKTMIFDAGIHHGNWKEAIGIEKWKPEKEGLSLVDYMAQSRKKYIDDLIKSGNLSASLRDTLFNRIDFVQQKANAIDGGSSSSTQAPVQANVSEYYPQTTATPVTPAQTQTAAPVAPQEQQTPAAQPQQTQAPLGPVNRPSNYTLGDPTSIPVKGPVRIEAGDTPLNKVAKRSEQAEIDKLSKIVRDYKDYPKDMRGASPAAKLEVRANVDRALKLGLITNAEHSKIMAHIGWGSKPTSVI